MRPTDWLLIADGCLIATDVRRSEHNNNVLWPAVTWYCILQGLNPGQRAAAAAAADVQRQPTPFNVVRVGTASVWLSWLCDSAGTCTSCGLTELGLSCATRSARYSFNYTPTATFASGVYNKYYEPRVVAASGRQAGLRKNIFIEINSEQLNLKYHKMSKWVKESVAVIFRFVFSTRLLFDLSYVLSMLYT